MEGLCPLAASAGVHPCQILAHMRAQGRRGHALVATTASSSMRRGPGTMSSRSKDSCTVCLSQSHGGACIISSLHRVGRTAEEHLVSDRESLTFHASALFLSSLDCREIPRIRPRLSTITRIAVRAFMLRACPASSNSAPSQAGLDS